MSTSGSALQLTTETKRVDKWFWLNWLLINTVGFSIGLIIILVGMNWVSSYFLVLIGAILGGAIGVTEWLILRRKVTLSRRWFLASLMGGGFGWLVGYFVFAIAVGLELMFTYSRLFEVIGKLQVLGLRFFNHNLTFGGAGLGIVIGLTQWGVLRRQIPNSHWWIWINMVSCSFGINAISAIAQVTNTTYDFWGQIPFVFSVFLSGFISLALIGYALVLLLNRFIRDLKLFLFVMALLVVLGNLGPILIALLVSL